MASLHVDADYSPSQQGREASCLGEKRKLLRLEKVYVSMYLSVSLCVYAMYGACRDKGTGTSGAGVTGGFEPLSMGSGNQTHVFLMSCKHS